MKKVAQKKLGQKKVRATKASTMRLKPELQSALDNISAQLDRPKNKIVNQAVAEYLEKTSYKLQDDIEGTLQKLRAYRSKDPSFEADIERFADGEAAYSSDDTHEGKMDDSVHSLSKEIQQLIHAWLGSK